ncbi:hypothetical protein JB92DRAFT_2929809 [Gautieria morchelliformis]|nr:hypothetical protein JB92DRAFT_2929809 [Gautieria morchelliformis]
MLPQTIINNAVMSVLRLLGFNIHCHPVFFNFVWTYLLYTLFMTFTCGCGIHGFYANRGNVGCGQGPQYSGQFYEVDVSIKIIKNAILCTAASAS